MTKTIQLDGYRLHLTKTDKFKNITIALKMAAPLTRETATIRTLLSFMFTGGCKKYPSSKEFSKYVEGLYGGRFSSSISSKGSAHIINIFSICVNDQYLLNESLLNKQIQLLNDVLLAPNIIDDAFDNKVFEQKKQELLWRLQTLKDDKYAYSLDRLFEEMGKDQTLGIATVGYENDLHSITAKQLYEYYLKCLEEDVFDIYIVGDIDDSIVEQFKNKFKFTNTASKLKSALTFTSSRTEVLKIVERQDINQAKLNLGYTIDTNFKSDDHYAFTVLSGLLGAFSHSLLFKTVREEHSLCYYVNSSYDAFNGIMVVTAGIESKDYQKAVKLISEQIKRVQDGDINDELLSITKGMLQNALVKSEDEAISMISLMYNRDLANKTETNQEYIEKLNSVSLEDVIRVSKKIKLDTIYLLTNKE